MSDQAKRVITVLDRTIDLINQDEEYADMMSDYLDDMLEDLLNYDAFGSEGQNDPRGDGRDGEWTLWRVQGID